MPYVFDTDDIERGVWCDTCALPSAVSFPSVWDDPHGELPSFPCVVTVCSDCRSQAVSVT